tara:strand:- start:191 stop:2170 length:1980 start_codon:yes stop_codon:yes gene_type:complete
MADSAISNSNLLVRNEVGLPLRERGELIFGENGAVVLLTDVAGNVAREMDDFEMESERRSRYPELAMISLLTITSATMIVVFSSFSALDRQLFHTIVFGTLTLTMLFLIVGAVGCYEEAVASDEVGSKNNDLPLPAHITGLGGAVAIFLAILVAAIFAIGQWQPYGFDLPESAGNGTIVGLAGIFALVFLSSRIPIPHSIDEIFDKLRKWTNGISGIGHLLSRIDAALVFGVAPIGGVTLRNPIIRYLVLLGQIISGGLLAWHCPSPLGLLGAFWVFVLVFGVVRRWGWIEHVRANRNQDPNDNDQRRIKHIVDLRDEAMTSLLLLVLIMPIAMRQVHLAIPLQLGFRIEGDAINDVFSWTGFFGVELLKALPFLDWADIYGARNAAHIHTNGAISMHAVFVARMIIDLVFLAALVQWVSISVAIEKNKRDFLLRRNGVVNLDERIERHHLSRLVQLGVDGKYAPTAAAQQYSHYDMLALSRLKLRHKGDERLLAAIREIATAANKVVAIPSEQLFEEAYRPTPRPKRLNEILNVVEQEKDFDLENLLLARAELNRKGGLENERKLLVQLMVRHVPPSFERDKQFAEILSGEASDSLRDVRRLVIDTLVRNARRNPDAISYLRRAVKEDNSRVVREHIVRTMLRFGISLDDSGTNRKSA